MSVKDVKEYYSAMESQYFELLNDAKYVSSEVDRGNLSIDVLNNINNMLLPMKQNYERLSYVMYLLNKPNKKNKKWYKKQNKNLEKSFEILGADYNSVVSENMDVLDKFKNYSRQILEESVR